MKQIFKFIALIFVILIIESEQMIMRSKYTTEISGENTESEQNGSRLERTLRSMRIVPCKKNMPDCNESFQRLLSKLRKYYRPMNNKYNANKDTFGRR